MELQKVRLEQIAVPNREVRVYFGRGIELLMLAAGQMGDSQDQTSS